jgi:isopentenyl-diphosphate delta-isomerase
MIKGFKLLLSIKFMEQTLIVVDDKDNILGYAPRNECHTGKGKRHRAFVVLLYGKDKKILLQHRKHKLFDKRWDLAGASHPLHIDGKDENYIEAASRCLRNEWGIENVRLEKIGAFNYFKEDGKNCENEYCALIIGKYDGELKANAETAYGFRMVSLEQLLSEVEKRPETFTPWSIEAVKILRNHELIETP